MSISPNAYYIHRSDRLSKRKVDKRLIKRLFFDGWLIPLQDPDAEILKEKYQKSHLLELIFDPIIECPKLHSLVNERHWQRRVRERILRKIARRCRELNVSVFHLEQLGDPFLDNLRKKYEELLIHLRNLERDLIHLWITTDPQMVSSQRECTFMKG